MILVILKINIDIINGGIASAIVGIFDKHGEKQSEFLVPGRMFAKDFTYIEGQELLLQPKDK